MATKALFHKAKGALHPVTDDARDVMRALADGSDVMVTVTAPRNPKHHRLFFALLKRIVDSGAWPYDVDSLLEWIKYRVGHVRVLDVGGRRYVTPKSIAFASMGQDKFRRFFERAVYHLSTEILGDPNWESLRDEIIAAVDGPYQGRQAA